MWLWGRLSEPTVSCNVDKYNMGKKQHYVPKFYLKHFESKKKRINMFYINGERFIPDVGLRDQCYNDFMYGSDGNLEEALANFESVVAPILQQCVNEGRLPRSGSEEMDMLVFFIALQMLRTEGRAKEMNDLFDTVMKGAYKKHPAFKDINLDDIRIVLDDPVQASLQNIVVVSEEIRDLKYKIVKSSAREDFITSDNPVFRYNIFKQGPFELPGIGIFEKGFLLFLPISPKYLVIAYDHTTYLSEGVDKIVNKVTRKDTRSCNKIQALNAKDALYFSSRDMSTSVRKAYESMKYKRGELGVRLTEFVQEGDSSKSLLRHHKKIPNLSLDLSFLWVNDRSSKIPPRNRINKMRIEPHPPPFEREDPGIPDGTKFIRIYS
jgi:hypothetical protein